MAATAALSGVPVSRLPGRRFDHVFFTAMAVVLFGSVFLGFAHSYYLAGVFHAPLPNLIVHFHGAAFTCWILLLIVQTSLVFAGRVDVHRKLGVAGFLLACLMVVLGVLVATDSLVRHAANPEPGADPRFFYIVPLSDLMIFAVIIFFAYRARRNPPAHKRLILVATIAIMLAAIARWPFAFINLRTAEYVDFAFLLPLVLYDLWSTRKIHPATLWASLLVIFVGLVRTPIGHTAVWHNIASWVISLVH